MSSAWDLSGENLVAVDNLFHRIVRYDLKGRVRGGLPDFVAGPLDELSPIGAANSGSYLVVKLRGDRFVRLGNDYSPQEQVDLHREAIRGGWQVASAFQFAPANGDLITFSDLKTTTEPADWKSAFLRIPLSDPAKFETLQDVSIDDTNMRLFYRLGHPYITSLGPTAYVLLMEEHLRLVQNKLGNGTFEPTGVVLPAGLSQRPNDIPYFSSAATFPDTMKGVEEAEMPTGLYGWEDALYMLARRPDREGTRWSLLKINPRGGANAVVAEATLPSHANHLVAVPGPRQWAFIEKGPVVSINEQEVRSAFFVPSPLVRNLEPGLLCEQ